LYRCEDDCFEDGRDDDDDDELDDDEDDDGVLDALRRGCCGVSP
jgi:hypothetical protein